ncbi:uncharacterized protein EV422DRAFT_563375 [Fimicolochytrium jonesii]|uniref:uncharacterized protein n=1 Tax=Fimicolochytrium jonesii TaxID=1396493 RepID=UPI0022FE9E8C|nr:uncharacterized protein EV422DRAFT_563375 [Fimicolochytrium jonesii]KAI8827290.1 hypothetical protein EV422DRAFT_563375 [Fimicolochytrium jonesii]
MSLEVPIELTIDRYYLGTVLKALLHSVLFHRTFSSERPIDIDVDSLSVTYARLENAEADRAVEEKVRDFERLVEPSTGRNRGQIAMLFFARRPKKSWFTTSEEEVCWEQWVITIIVRDALSERDQLASRRTMQNDLIAALTTISHITNEQKDHIPPIVNNDPFPFQIVVSPHTDASWASMFKQMISSGGPWLSTT